MTADELDPAAQVEITFKVDPKNKRHMAAIVLFKEIEKLELAHNALDARVTELTTTAAPHWSEEEIRAAYDHGSTAGTCEDVDDVIAALHHLFDPDFHLGAAGGVQPAPTAEYGRGFNAAETLAHEVMARNEALAMRLDSKTSSYTEGYADGMLRVVEDLMETLPPGAFPQPSAGGSTDGAGTAGADVAPFDPADHYEEVLRAGLRWRHQSERQDERIDRLRHAVAALRVERDALAEELDRATDLVPYGAKRDRDYSSQVMARLRSRADPDQP